jgi:hypothetical protein
MNDATPGERWRWALLAASILAAASAFWVFDALPFQDLPAHAGLIAMRHRFAGSAFEQRYYKLGSQVGPYAAFLFLGELYDRFLGPMGAVRALATMPVLATPAALLFARRRLHRDRAPWAGFLGVALSFGFMTLLGLASYLLGVALLVVALTVWLELLDDVDRGLRARKRELVFGAAALSVSLAHGYAFAVLVALAALTAAASGDRYARLVRLRALAPGISVAAWSIAFGGPPPGSAGTFELVRSADFRTPLDKLSLLVTPTLMTRWGLDVVVGLAIWGVLLASLRATLRDHEPHTGGADRRSRSHARALAITAAGTAALFLALPHAFKWFGFIDGRMLPIFLFLIIACVRRPALGPRLGRVLDGVAVGAACTMTAIVLYASSRFQAEARGYREVLGAVPALASVLNLPIDPDSDVFTAHPFVHYDKLTAIEHDVLLSDIWADRATALYATPDNPQARLPVEYNSANLKRLDWAAFDLSDWSYVLIRTRPEASAPETPGLALAKHAGGFWLYAGPGR